MKTHLRISVFTDANGWVPVIDIPLEEPMEDGPELQKGVAEVNQALYKNDKMYFDLEDKSVCMRNMDKRIFMVRAVKN